MKYRAQWSRWAHCLSALAFLLFAHGPCSPVYAGELKPLNKGDFTQIKAHYKGTPFIVVLWGIECPHCKHVLPEILGFIQKTPAVQLVVISTDSLHERDTIQLMLDKMGLGKQATWVFNDAAPERLRYEIDPKWRGEMPRIYLVDKHLDVKGISGTLRHEELQAWWEKYR